MLQIIQCVVYHRKQQSTSYCNANNFTVDFTSSPADLGGALVKTTLLSSLPTTNIVSVGELPRPAEEWQ